MSGMEARINDLPVGELRMLHVRAAGEVAGREYAMKMIAIEEAKKQLKATQQMQ
jgi:hypothetical protein